MNEQQLRHLLNQGITVRPQIAARLAQAREQAVARLRPEPASALAWAGNVADTVGGWGGFALRVLLPLAILAGGGIAVYTWQQNQRAAEIEEVDTLLLADDLPIDAYLDRGFQNWLRKRNAAQ